MSSTQVCKFIGSGQLRVSIRLYIPKFHNTCVPDTSWGEVYITCSIAAVARGIELQCQNGELAYMQETWMCTQKVRMVRLFLLEGVIYNVTHFNRYFTIDGCSTQALSSSVNAFALRPIYYVKTVW